MNLTSDYNSLPSINTPPVNLNNPNSQVTKQKSSSVKVTNIFNFITNSRTSIRPQDASHLTLCLNIQKRSDLLMHEIIATETTCIDYTFYKDKVLMLNTEHYNDSGREYDNDDDDPHPDPLTNLQILDLKSKESINIDLNIRCSAGKIARVFQDIDFAIVAFFDHRAKKQGMLAINLVSHLFKVEYSNLHLPTVSALEHMFQLCGINWNSANYPINLGSPFFSAPPFVNQNEINMVCGEARSCYSHVYDYNNKIIDIDTRDSSWDVSDHSGTQKNTISESPSTLATHVANDEMILAVRHQEDTVFCVIDLLKKLPNNISLSDEKSISGFLKFVVPHCQRIDALAVSRDWIAFATDGYQFGIFDRSKNELFFYEKFSRHNFVGTAFAHSLSKFSWEEDVVLSINGAILAACFNLHNDDHDYALVLYDLQGRIKLKTEYFAGSEDPYKMVMKWDNTQLSILNSDAFNQISLLTTDLAQCEKSDESISDIIEEDSSTKRKLDQSGEENSDSNRVKREQEIKDSEMTNNDSSNMDP